MQQTSTRHARPEDLPVLALFERELARSNFPDDPIEDLDYHTERLRKALVREPEGMVVLVAPDTQDIIAWLWLVTRRTLATGEAYGVLRSLYVRPPARGAGLGAQLAHYAARYFQERSVHRVVATVHSQNLAGLRTFAKAGFRPVHTTLEWRP
jgi:L-amino acid N-acyltransferase YncA